MKKIPINKDFIFIVCELKRQTDVNVHHNVIRFYGITKLNSENEIDQSKNYLLVMEYADGGNLRNYLKKNFDVTCTPVIYCVGVLLWEISSGKPPFEDESDVNLAVRILQGLREKIIPNTSIDYEKLYTECWDGEPDNRPSINEVVKRLKTITHQQNENINNITYQISNENSTSLNELNEESLINNYTSINSTVDEDLCDMVNDILMKICEITNEGKEQPYLFLNYLII
ncbi:unnamed protein product [Rhizophagus irregularis]|uniref:Protein kinase domain-containing protein n=1 Tax=Rhizophagus irregularis TaxID=588596 RepID=A0A915YV00_9GLOM|nr:unnamed protein product [Rhizophagus irregularis]